jgi:hypothetical protein
MAQPGNGGAEGLRNPGAVVAPLLVIAICLAFVYNNLAPYAGLNSAGAMVMFSGLSKSFDTHLFLPRYSVTDDFEYVRVVEMSAHPPNLPAARELSAFLSALPARERVNRNFLRYQASRICGAAPDVALRLSLRRSTGDRVEVADACGQAEWRGYAVLSGYEVCLGNCDRLLVRWARGQLRDG